MALNGFHTFYGVKTYYKNDKLHRDDGPAIEYDKKYKMWFRNGLLHREDGAAIEYHDGRKEYFLYGQNLTEQQFLDKTQLDGDKVVRNLDKIKSILEF